MTTSDEIRALAGQGLSVTEIASRLGVTYQHAYGVLKRDASSPPRRPRQSPSAVAPQRGHAKAKPPLPVDVLTGAGFTVAGRWVLTETGGLVLDRPAPAEPGVYAFAIDGTVLYVGVATVGLARRLYFFAKPGPSQPTNHRLNGLIRAELAAGRSVEILTASPGDLEWNGLPVHGGAGLELGLIRAYALPWNGKGGDPGTADAAPGSGEGQ